MTAPAPTRAKARLLDLAPLGKPIEFKAARRIEADLIRRLVLRLPAAGEKALPPSVGLHLVGAIIEGRLVLDDAMAADGGHLPALEFQQCLFDGGFSGAHGHFSRLAFGKCRFRGAGTTGDGKPVPTINLSGASLQSDLGMRGICPAGPRDYLWIRAPGVQIDGQLDLSCAQLRAPPDTEGRLISEPAPDALNLARGTVQGDVLLVNGFESRGRINARGARISGEVWMSGAMVENRGGSALFFQGATIEGLMVLDSRPGTSDRSGNSHPFRCIGNLNLLAAELGRDLDLTNAVIRGDAVLADLSVKNDLILGARCAGTIYLTGCTIGGSLDLSDLTLGASSHGMALNEGRIGRSLKLIRSDERRPREAGPALLACRRAALASLPGLELVETLWDYEIASGCREAVQVGFLLEGSRIYRLDGYAAVLDEAVARVGHGIREPRHALEYLRLHCTYPQIGEDASPVILGKDEGARPPFLAVDPRRSRRPFAALGEKIFAAKAVKRGHGFVVTACLLEDDRLCRSTLSLSLADRAIAVIKRTGTPRGPALIGMPRSEGPLFRHPHLDPEQRAAAIRDRRWVSGETVAGMRCSEEAELGHIEAMFAPHLESTVSLHGEINLENLTCDMLHDSAGRYWGSDVRIEMNHFVYNRTTWEPDAVEARGTLRERAYNWWRRFAAERLPCAFVAWLDRGETAPRPPRWEPWQARRNWIYQQFRGERLPCPSRYRIDQSEYRPQPFEQAIRVARAEGRDDFAVHFEILKRKIEWRLFTRRSRQPLLGLGMIAAMIWLFARGGIHPQTFVAALGLIGAILPMAPLRPPGRGRLDIWLRGAAALGAVVAVTWWLGLQDWDRPRNFLIALLILLTIRFLSAIADWIMYRLFGYFRRPVRAIGTLIGAFLIGWAGVHAAKQQGMLVVDVNPVASVVGRDRENQQVVGIDLTRETEGPVRDLPCPETVSEALYALDVLIPLIDLREESRCEVGRARSPARAAGGAGSPQELSSWVRAVKEWTIESEGFWAVLKALYAIAGWFIVSLSILTFAQVNRTVEPS